MTYNNIWDSKDKIYQIIFFIISKWKKKVNWDEEHIQRATKVLFVPIKLRKWEKV